MKLDFCFLSYVSPDLRIAGGTTHFIQNLSRWCESNGKVSVWTTRDAALLISRFADKCEVNPIGFASASLANSTLGVSIGLAIRAIQSFLILSLRTLNRKPELIVTESHFLPDVVAAIALHNQSKAATLIAYVHHIAPSPVHRRYHPLVASTLAWLAQTLSLTLIKKWNFHILTFSKVKLELLRLGFSESRIHGIRNGIDLRYINAIAPSKNKYDACFLGNALPRKGILDLPSIWHEICKEFPLARLAIIGTGARKQIDELRHRFQSLGLEGNVSFMGFLSERDKIATLKASRVFLFPSYEEGWGIAIAEAMACKLPVVAYNLPAYEKIFDKGIIRVPIGAFKEFADVAISLLKDEENRVRLGQDGKSQAEEYDLEKIAATELHLIKEMHR